MPYQTKELAKIIGVSGQTVRRWSKDFAQYLSPTAQPKDTDGYYRRAYTLDDLRVLWTVHIASQNGALQEEIADQLAAGLLMEELPADLPLPEDEPVDMMPVSTAVEKVKALQAHIDFLEDEIDRLRALADSRAEQVTKAERELGDARSELAKLQGRYEGEVGAIARERLLLTRALIAVAVVAAILLAVVLLLALTGGGAG